MSGANLHPITTHTSCSIIEHLFGASHVTPVDKCVNCGHDQTDHGRRELIKALTKAAGELT